MKTIMAFRWPSHKRTAKSELSIFAQCVVIICALSAVTGLQLEGLSTKKPRTTKYSRTTPSPDGSLLSGNLVGPLAPVPTPSTTSLYRVNRSSGVTCILLKTDALLSIKYTNKLGEQVESDAFVPDEANIAGNCNNDDFETMTISFRGFKILWSFAKTPGGDSWFVSRIELLYNTNNKLLEHVDKTNIPLTLSTPTKHGKLLFPTPVGKSYGCTTEKAIELENYDPQAEVKQTAVLYLRDFQLQAFMFKAKNAFGPIFACSSGGSLRDETAPIAVGATLSIAVLCTITGYGIFRYLKVKKVQYDTME